MTQGTLNRRYYKRIGRCPRCNGRNALMDGEQNCPECQIKSYEASLRRNKETYNKTHREWSKKVYKERKEKGVCTRCGKHKAIEGEIRCATCKNKDTSARLAREFHLTRFERGLCRWCDNPVEKGFKVCEYHHQMQIEKCKKSKGKSA